METPVHLICSGERELRKLPTLLGPLFFLYTASVAHNSRRQSRTPLPSDPSSFRLVRHPCGPQSPSRISSPCLHMVQVGHNVSSNPFAPCSPQKCPIAQIGIVIVAQPFSSRSDLSIRSESHHQDQAGGLRIHRCIKTVFRALDDRIDRTCTLLQSVCEAFIQCVHAAARPMNLSPYCGSTEHWPCRIWAPRLQRLAW